MSEITAHLQLPETPYQTLHPASDPASGLASGLASGRTLHRASSTLADFRDASKTRNGRRQASRKNRGFTLLEMLAVIVLIAIVATVTVRQIGNGITKGKVGAGKAQLSSLGMKIDSYTMDNGSPPASLNALSNRPDDAPNWHGPYARPSELRDPFGHAFGYKAPGDHGNDYDLIFFGRDGRPGGTGYDADFGNWQ